jgi:Carboxypeptidase regulatory-like domain
VNSRAGAWGLLAVTSVLLGQLALPAAAVATAARPGPAPAVSGPAPAAAPTAPAAGAISGTVLGAGGAPLARACVTATGTTAAARTMTSASGRYEIGGLRPGAYAIEYRDCAEPGAYFPLWYGGVFLPSQAKRVGLLAGQHLALRPVTLRATNPAAASAAGRRAALGRLASAVGNGNGLPPGYSGLSGFVRSRAGKPLAGICASAYYSTASGGGGTGTSTTRRGWYGLVIGPPGNWYVEFTGGCGNHGNFAPQWWRYSATSGKATIVRPATNRNFHGIDARLRPGATITGTVRASDTGKGLAGICVDAYGVGGQAGDGGEFLAGAAQAVTSATGSYRIPDLGTGRYALEYDPSCFGQKASRYLDTFRPGLVRVTDGRTTAGVNEVVPLGATISGTVTHQAGGTPLPRICVNLTGGAAYQGDGYVLSAADGSYSFTGLPAGSYQVSFFNDGCGSRPAAGSFAAQFYPGQASFNGSRSVTVRDGQAVSGIDAAMAPGGTVTGRVTNRAGQPVARICVQLEGRYLAGGYGPGFAQVGASPALNHLLDGNFPMQFPGAVTSAAGTYTVRNLAPGQYSAFFTPTCGRNSGKYGQQWFAPVGGGSPQFISVGSANVTAGVDAVMPVGGSITGVVTDTSGRRLPGICLSAYPASLDTFEWGYVGSDGQTRRRGTFALANLTVGRYLVFAEPCQGEHQYAGQYYDGTAFRGSARLVRVKSGRESAIRVRMVVGGAVTGRITAVGGEPVRYACVALADSDGNQLATTFAGPRGAYSFQHVMPGRYEVQAAQCASGSPKAGASTRAADVTVRSGRALRDINVGLPAAGVITGSVLAGPSAGAPGVCVDAIPLRGRIQAGLAVATANGSYRLTGLTPGRYRVYFWPYCAYDAGENLTAGWYSDGSGHPATVTVSARAAVSGISGLLAPEGAITGTVTTGANAAVPGACVAAFAGASARPSAIAIVGSDGGYEIAGLEAGSYRVEFSSGCGASGYAAQWWDSAVSRAKSQPVLVQPGATTSGISAVLSG